MAGNDSWFGASDDDDGRGDSIATRDLDTFEDVRPAPGCTSAPSRTHGEAIGASLYPAPSSPQDDINFSAPSMPPGLLRIFSPAALGGRSTHVASIEGATHANGILATAIMQTAPRRTSHDQEPPNSPLPLTVSLPANEGPEDSLEAFVGGLLEPVDNVDVENQKYAESFASIDWSKLSSFPYTPLPLEDDPPSPDLGAPIPFADCKTAPSAFDLRAQSSSKETIEIKIRRKSKRAMRDDEDDEDCTKTRPVPSLKTRRSSNSQKKSEFLELDRSGKPARQDLLWPAWDHYKKSPSKSASLPKSPVLLIARIPSAELPAGEYGNGRNRSVKPSDQGTI